MRGWRTRALLLLLGVLMAALTLGPAAASPLPQEEEQRGLFGKVLNVAIPPTGPALLSLETPEGTVEVEVTKETAIKVPGRETASVADISPGDSLALLVKVVGERFEALRILVKPQKPTEHRHVVGIVVETEDHQITIVDTEGNRVTVNLPVGLAGIPPGEAVTAIVQREPLAGGLSARGLDLAQEVIDRLNRGLEKAQEEARKELEERLKELIEENAARHLTALNEVLQRVAPQAEATIRQVLERTQRGHRQALEALGLRRPVIRIIGVITFIDHAQNTVTVSPEVGEPLTVAVTEETEIEVEDEEGVLEDLVLGHRVLVQYDPETLEARKIKVVRQEVRGERLEMLLEKAEEGEVQGRVSEVDTQATPPTVTITPREGDPVTLIVTPDTEIKVAEEEVPLENLPLDVAVKAEYDPETLETREIETFEERPGQAFIAGVVSGLVRKAKEVTVTSPEGESFTLKVSDTTVIERNGLRVSIADIRLGDLVRPSTRYLLDTTEALRLALKTPRPSRLEGTVTGKETTPQGKNELTITTRKLELVTLAVTDATELTRRGEEATFDDVAVGDRVVSGLYDLATLEAIKLAIQPPKAVQIRGTVQAVNKQVGTLTIQPREGDPVTIGIFLRTVMEKHGDRKATLADLQVGDAVLVAFYNPETLEALKVVVRSARALTIRGIIQGVDTERGEVTIGLDDRVVTLRVTRSTRIFKDDKPASLGNLAVNDRVPVAFYKGDREAISIVALSRPAPLLPQAREARFAGVIREMTEERWVVNGRALAITPDTEIKGTPQVGSPVQVRARLSDGTIVALEIEVKEVRGRRR